MSRLIPTLILIWPIAACSGPKENVISAAGRVDDHATEIQRIAAEEVAPTLPDPANRISDHAKAVRIEARRVTANAAQTENPATQLDRFGRWSVIVAVCAVVGLALWRFGGPLGRLLGLAIPNRPRVVASAARDASMSGKYGISEKLRASDPRVEREYQKIKPKGRP